MRIPTPIQALSAAAALALLAGCSSGSSIAPSASSSIQSHHFVNNSGRVPSVLNPVGMLRLHNLSGAQPSKAHFNNTCPATGTLVYMSDFNLSEVIVYKGGGTTPLVQCNVLTGFANPQGMIVKGGKVWIANTGALSVVEVGRNSSTPITTYTDPTCSGQFPVDVTVSGDGYVYANNIFGGSCAGSISVWTKSGTYVTTIPNANGANNYFLTIQKDGTMYYDDNTFALYKGSCLAGSCSSFSNTGASFAFPGGLRSEDGEDVALDDQSASGGGALLTYEPPNFSTPGTCSIGGSDPVSFDVNHSQHHAFFADAGLDQLTELKYTNTTGACAPKFTAAGQQSGLPIGVGVDRAEALK